jgi:hypothetical protein
MYIHKQASADYVLKTPEDLGVARRECVAELGIPATTVEEYRNKVFKPEGPTPCYIRCVFRRLGLFDDKSGFIIDNYVRQLGRGDGVVDEVRGCFDHTGEDTCFWAFRGFTCFLRKGLLPEGY